MPERATHPSPDELSAYGLGQLPANKAEVVEKHISECEPCCETIADLAADDTFLVLLQDARSLPDDRTDVHDRVSTEASSSMPVPVELTEHPRYEVLCLIGKGGMGDVYKARHCKMERMVAVKVINCELVGCQQTHIIGNSVPNAMDSVPYSVPVCGRFYGSGKFSNSLIFPVCDSFRANCFTGKQDTLALSE